MRLVVAIALAFAPLTGCANDDDLAPSCGVSCKVEGAKGPCRLGTWVCAEGEPPKCVGATPTPETCDNVDNDCDGFTDEGTSQPAWAPWDQPGTNPCPVASRLGACASAFTRCAAGQWSCYYPPDYEPVESRCDLIDNDCDGLTDYQLPLASTPCYDGPVGTGGVGICDAGWLVCHRGNIVCDGSKVPITELCGNGLDDDCDGFTDEAEDPTPTDAVIAFEKSGSMWADIRNLTAALQILPRSPTHRYALVDGSRHPSWVLAQDFADLDTTIDNLAAAVAGDWEDMFKPMSLAARGQLPVSWREGVRRVYLSFSDEEPQTRDGSALEPFCYDPTTVHVEIYKWTQLNQGGDQWIPFVTGCGGYVYEIRDLGVPSTVQPLDVLFPRCE